MDDKLRDMQGHSFQRAFLLQFEGNIPILKFKKNLMKNDWVGVWNAPEIGLQLLIDPLIHCSVIIPPQPLADKLMHNLSLLSTMTPDIVCFWNNFPENQDHDCYLVLPEEWTKDFFGQIPSSSESSEVNSEEPDTVEERITC